MTHVGEYYGALICGTANIESPYRPARDRNGRTLVMGSHRNPWDHYVSLWAFGVGGACCVVTLNPTQPTSSRPTGPPATATAARW
jgi:hypothetical protein